MQSGSLQTESSQTFLQLQLVTVTTKTSCLRCIQPTVGRLIVNTNNLQNKKAMLPLKCGSLKFEI